MSGGRHYARARQRRRPRLSDVAVRLGLVLVIVAGMGVAAWCGLLLLAALGSLLLGLAG